MKKTLFLITATLLMHGAFAAKPKNKYVEIQTEHGICTVKLYNETPMHTDNFLKLVKSGFYNGLLFHRVIENFMIQGGDPNSRYAAEKQILGQGDVDYRIPAEIQNDLFHRKGVLAAARDDNPEKASSGAQFYLVQGRIFTDEELDRLEEHRLEGRKIPDSHREVYKTIGGVPHLDQNYTVFGEIVKGLKMVDAIAALPTDQMDRPLEDQKMKMRILKRREVRKLEKELINNNQL